MVILLQLGGERACMPVRVMTAACRRITSALLLLTVLDSTMLVLCDQVAHLHSVTGGWVAAVLGDIMIRHCWLYGITPVWMRCSA
jgi:hypothetical protein